MILVGCKQDCRKPNQKLNVTAERLNHAKTYTGATVTAECSSKLHDHIKEVFMQAIKMKLERDDALPQMHEHIKASRVRSRSHNSIFSCFSFSNSDDTEQELLNPSGNKKK